ncbi:MYG1 [Arthroderma uncinatum]|uniref:MYG1 n=1 Tax=Arthroderma uncinatum TaxID=74035 RepID=UPI00144AE3F7|nr:MYG1 [Arthroderma uncinatum]KAF3482620.1 MYG1 [Arthroderma uncinatum]
MNAIRRFIKMAEETGAKRLKSPPLIGTHNGHFHADEALAVYLLRLLPAYSGSPLIRTRDPAQLATCHTVVDVGGVYDPSLNRYDHHQRTFNTTFPQHDTKLSSAGLVYMHFGKAIIAQHMNLPVDHQDVDTIYNKLYGDYIEALDAHDNGISVYCPKAISNAGLEKRFRDGGINLGSLIGDMNRPGPGEDLDEDALFARASTFIGETFWRKLHAASGAWLPARASVAQAYQSRFDVHPSGKILLFPKSGIPWKEHLYRLEGESGSGTATDSERKVIYVLYPDSSAADANWRVQCVPVTESSFESRKALPETWRGARDSELDAIIATEMDAKKREKIPEGAVFVHASGFIGGHKTKEGALAMAVESLN